MSAAAIKSDDFSVDIKIDHFSVDKRGPSTANGAKGLFIDEIQATPS